jgi:hypothetical protein
VLTVAGMATPNTPVVLADVSAMVAAAAVLGPQQG